MRRAAVERVNCTFAEGLASTNVAKVAGTSTGSTPNKNQATNASGMRATISVKVSVIGLICGLAYKRSGQPSRPLRS